MARSLIAGTAAAEKIYRSTGPDAEMDVKLDVGEGAQLAWLPQETILFDRARLSRRIDVDLAESASLLMAEAVVFGRAAMGEAMREGFFADRWRVRRARQADLRRQRAARRRYRRKAWPARRRPPAASPSPPCWSAPGDDGKLAAVRALSRTIHRRGRHFGLERHRGGAALRQGRRRACATI